ncbi:MAG: hypothetical protein R3275_07460 [Saprospiraceae bacterium]|nr:hypothetical protein [Saprospiraceae bacterium]
MIKLFRNIRRTLLSEGRLGRYFFYALGEIVLVVIGILIVFRSMAGMITGKMKSYLKHIGPT